MKKYNFCIIILLISITLAVFLHSSNALAVEQPAIDGKAGILVNVNTGQVVWAQKPNEKLPPASTTKILTALIALEKGNLKDEVTVSEKATMVEGTRVYLEKGEKKSLEELLNAMLINSANDAAYVIAEHIGGSMEGFAKLMNEKAKELGAVNSNFVNSNGLTVDGHYTTARDLALIARKAMQNNTFKEIVKTKTKDWQGQAWQSTLINQNKLLFQNEDIIGVKTGYTSLAKNCLVAAAEQNGNTFLTVILGSSGNIFNESRKLLDYGFKNYHTEKLVSKDNPAVETTVKGQVLKIMPKADLFHLQSNLAPIVPDKNITLEELKVPLVKGSVIGKIDFTYQGKSLGSTELIAGNDLKKVYGLSFIWMVIANALALVFLMNIIRKIIFRNKIKKRNIFGKY